MPVRPENKHYYEGPEWKAIRREILDRANHRCERCGVSNHDGVLRTDSWKPYPDQPPASVYVSIGSMEIQSASTGEVVGTFSGFPSVLDMLNHLLADGWRQVKIILTTAHLDHDPRNNSRNNLQSLCQRCHNRHDASHRAETRRASRQSKNNARGATGASTQPKETP